MGSVHGPIEQRVSNMTEYVMESDQRKRKALRSSR